MNVILSFSKYKCCLFIFSIYEMFVIEKKKNMLLIDILSFGWT